MLYKTGATANAKILCSICVTLPSKFESPRRIGDNKRSLDIETSSLYVSSENAGKRVCTRKGVAIYIPIDTATRSVKKTVKVSFKNFCARASLSPAFLVRIGISTRADINEATPAKTKSGIRNAA